MLKRLFALCTLSLAVAIGGSTFAQEIPVSQMFIAGAELSYDADAGTVTISDVNGILPFNALQEDGTTTTVWFNADEFLGGWGSTEAGAALATTGTFVVEKVITTGNVNELVSVVFPVTLADVVAVFADEGGVTVTFNVGVDELSKEAEELLAEPAADFMLVVDYTPEFAEGILPAIQNWIDAGRVTTSRPCSPRTLC